jgi:LmbE family N-acetylglucosaminyl deacetylase
MKISSSIKMTNILFIGAHPDDIELGCGGTLIKHLNNKYNVFALIVSDGERGLNGNRYKRITETKNALVDIGFKESNIIFLHIPDTLFIENRKVILSSIEQICEEHNVERVYTHTNKEYHQDHIVVFEETLRGARKVPDILTYETNAHTFSTFSPNYFVDISDVFDKKVLLLNHHHSQAKKEYFKPDVIESLAKFRGSQAKKCYAEGFEIIRMVI